MFMWILLIIVLFFLNIILHSTNKNKKKIFLFILFGMSAIILGLRGLQVGRDTQEYYNIFNSVFTWDFEYILSDNYNQKIEFGYAFIMKLSSIIWNNYFFFQFWTSCLFCYFIAKFIYDNTTDLFMASVLFLGSGLFLQAFTVTRQYLAVAIVINAWTMLKNQKYLKALIFLIVASLIHNTSVIFIIAFIAYILRNNKWWLRLIPIISIFIAFNYRSVFSIIKPYIPQYSTYLSNTTAKISAGGSMVMWIIVGFIAMIVVLNKQINVYLRVEAIFCIMFSILSFVGIYINYIDRLAYFFLPFLMIVLPEFKNQIKQLGKKGGLILSDVSGLYRSCVIFCYLAFYVISVRSSYLQYKLFWLE